MNFRKTATVCCFLTVGALATTGALSQTTGAKGIKFAPPTLDPSITEEAKMAAMMQYGTPGAHHKALGKFVGNWDINCEFWMAGPGSEATVTPGKAKVEWILDGRYIKEDFSCDFAMTPDQPPMKFKGVGVTGYDNFAGHYTGTWMDNMGTAIMTMTGHANMDGTALIFAGMMDEPGMGVNQRPVISVHRFTSETTHVFEMYDMGLGVTNNMVMRMTYTKAR